MKTVRKLIVLRDRSTTVNTENFTYIFVMENGRTNLDHKYHDDRF